MKTHLCTCHPIPPDFLVKGVISSAVVEAVFESNFSRIEGLAKRYRESQARTPGGAWELSVLYNSISDSSDALHPRDEYPFKKAEAKSLRWIAAFPNSPTPYIVYSEQLIAHGWFCWRCRDSNSDPASAKKKMLAYLERARAVLETSKSVAAADPEWYVAMLSVALGERWPKSRFEPVLREGLDRFPYYTHIYFAGSSLYLPIHGGNIDDFDSFVDDAVGRTAPEEGTALYARIYAHNAYAFDNMFKTSHASWPKMYNAFADLEKHYPDIRNDNLFAYFACAAGDKIWTAHMMPRLRNAPPDYEVWGNQDNINRCNAWAADRKAKWGESPMPSWQPLRVWPTLSRADRVILYDIAMLLLIEKTLFL